MGHQCPAQRLPDRGRALAVAEAQRRPRNAAEIGGITAAWTGKRTLGHAMTVFEEANVAAAPVYHAEQARGVRPSIPDAEFGSVRVRVPVPRFSATSGHIDHSAPSLGEHNEEVHGGPLGPDAGTRREPSSTGNRCGRRRSTRTSTPRPGQVLGEVSRGGDEQIDQAVAAARRARTSWRATTPEQRAALLCRLADLIQRDAEELARLESQDTGKPLSQARNDARVCARYFRFYRHAIDSYYGCPCRCARICTCTRGASHTASPGTSWFGDKRFHLRRCPLPRILTGELGESTDEPSTFTTSFPERTRLPARFLPDRTAPPPRSTIHCG